ncbi:MAG: RNA-binding protein [Candidatus Diapherotrites archaeon]|nr:RNA-binding protein [Candidatus Diapherotrites archaeon]
MREIVIPGEEISDKNLKVGEGSYIKEGKVYSSVYGMVSVTGNTVRVVPLHGKYIPKRGDQVIGIAKTLTFKGIFVDINSPYDGFLPLERIRYHVGDVMLADVARVSNVNEVTLDRPKRLSEGRVVEIQPTKIPRVIGRKGSMLRVIREVTGSYLTVGRNGRIFVKADDDIARVVEEALKMIEKEALSYGLTARVKEFLESRMKEEGK